MRTIVLGLLILVGSLAFADPALDSALSFLAPADSAALMKDQSLTVFSDRFENLRLWKGGPFEQAVKTLFAHRDSTLAAEALFVIPVTLPKDPVGRDLVIEKAMTSVSTMKGLQVYSISLKRMETFIFDAYRTQTTDKASRLPDWDVQANAGPVSFVMYQKEEQTGESFARYTFTKEPGWFNVTQTNLTTLSYSIVPLVSPGMLLTSVYVVPFENTLLVYGVTVAKTFSLFGWERSKTASLYTRMSALVTWFSNNLRQTP